jgi:hypothetical protein
VVTENGGNVPQRAAIGSEVEYMLVAVAVVGVNAELSGRMCGEVLDETSVSVGFGTAIDFALHRPDWWARLVEARRVDTQRAHLAELDYAIESVDRVVARAEAGASW